MGDLQSLRVFINCLAQESLPRVLQVCSGVYFQGSVYELSGSEVCLSTGDLVKIIGLELLSVSCEEIDTGETYALPTDYSGQFRLVAEDLPYNTIEEIVGLCPVGVDACGSFIFTSSNELIIDNFTVPAGRHLTLLSVDVSEDGERVARCHVLGQNKASAEILLPLSLRGQFYEQQSDRGYSLQEIMSSARLSCRHFRSASMKNGGVLLAFSPVYEISAIMHMRKNVVKFPSSLEVDVQDVTEQFQDLVFITPLSLTEVAGQPEERFPTMAEILDGPEGNQFFNCSWFKELYRGKHLVLHKCVQTKLILASTPQGRKGKQYYFISERYGGRLRRRAREFGSVYELYLASCQSPGLKVSVTRHCEAAEEEGVPALSVGEQLEVLRTDGLQDKPGASPGGDSLICKRTMEVDDDDDDDDEEDDSEEISLPLFMEGHFAEKLSDNKKYNLSDLMSRALPLDVKVVTRDKELEKDPLMGLTALKLEETFTETVVLASLSNKPDWCFELPVRWLQMSVCLTSDLLPWSSDEPPQPRLETVTEVTEKFYYEYHKLVHKFEEPPPRPPKRKPSASEAPKKTPKGKLSAPNVKSNVTEQLANLWLQETKGKRAPAPPPPGDQTDDEPPPILPRKSFSTAESSSLPNMYVKTPVKGNKAARRLSDSDHDYESIEEMIKNPHESIFY